MPVKLADIFTEHMVLQRDQPLPIWGWAEAGTPIRVTFNGDTAVTTTPADGQWRVTLPACAAGGPYVMTITTHDTMLTLADILVGEVWVCSGQSNMEWTLRLVQEAMRAQGTSSLDELAGADYPAIRFYTVPQCAEPTVQSAIDAAWQLCTARSAGDFSAVAYYFGRQLYRKLGVPIGLINTSWGGTICEAWTSREALLSEPTLRGMVSMFDSQLAQPNSQQQYQQALAEWERDAIPTDPGNTGVARGWADPSKDIHDWSLMALPTFWQRAGHPYSGVFWFRREVGVPAAWAGQDCLLRLGPCDKSDITYFNNVPVGAMSTAEQADAWDTPRQYRIPGELVQAGRNVIAVRIFSNIYAGGMHGKPEHFALVPVTCNEEPPIPLAGDWSYTIEYNFGQVPATPPPPQPPMSGNPNSPSVLYNGMIAPLVPYALRGAIWYQGESNADRAEQYRTLFPTMIRDWRAHWGQGDFPFYFVQLANFNRSADPTEPSDCEWAELREAQLMTLALPNTGMAVTIDIGDAEDIHPLNKWDVGLRLARHALAHDFGQSDIVSSGPLYRALQSEGERIRLFFDETDGGLLVKGDQLSGFAIAGKDRHFVWADAVIDGDTVVVSSACVPAPVAVRYGWANDPDCNLYNAAGLPASPFRTDDWAPRKWGQTITESAVIA